MPCRCLGVLTGYCIDFGLEGLWCLTPFSRIFQLYHSIYSTNMIDVQNRWFSLETLVSFTNKTDLYDITEIFLKMALNTIILLIQNLCSNQQYFYVNQRSQASFSVSKFHSPTSYVPTMKFTPF
jgi:hypothetical protein